MPGTSRVSACPAAEQPVAFAARHAPSVIDATGTIVHADYKVKSTGDAERVLAMLK